MRGEGSTSARYMNRSYRLGIDIGSTTVKIAVLDEENRILFSDYERHYANIQETLALLLTRAVKELGSVQVYPVITGSGGLTLAQHLHIPFVQEVVAVSEALQTYAPKTDVAIELGGEDAKIIYFQNGNVEQRMNGICAGGTGSFIDQMASLLQTDATGLNEYAKSYQALYSIADAGAGGICQDGYPSADTIEAPRRCKTLFRFPSFRQLSIQIHSGLGWPR